MKNLINIFLALMIIILISACDNPTKPEPGKNSLIGKWFFYTDGYFIYDPTFDNYYSAEIVEITKDKIIFYMNEPDTSYDAYVSINYILIADMIIPDIEESRGSIYYSFEDDMLVLEWSDSSKDYLKKYTGDFPPTSWTTALENDDYEPDNNYSDANSLIVGADSQKHTITIYDADWFKFQATNNNTYMIKILGYMDNVLTLYDKDGQTYITEDDDNDWGIDTDTWYWLSPVLVWNCESTEEYYFKVTGCWEDYDTGYYTVKVSLTDIESPLYTLKKNGPKRKIKGGLKKYLQIIQ